MTILRLMRQFIHCMPCVWFRFLLPVLNILAYIIFWHCHLFWLLNIPLKLCIFVKLGFRYYFGQLTHTKYHFVHFVHLFIFHYHSFHYKSICKCVHVLLLTSDCKTWVFFVLPYFYWWYVLPQYLWNNCVDLIEEWSLFIMVCIQLKPWTLNSQKTCL